MRKTEERNSKQILLVGAIRVSSSVAQPNKHISMEVIAWQSFPRLRAAKTLPLEALQEQ